MPKIEWDATGEHIYETGVDHGVLYPAASDGTYPHGVPWNGLTSVSETPSGAEETPIYADNIKYLSMLSVEEFGATVEAYTYPDEFAVCDGSEQPEDGVFIGQQSRKTFGMAYRTKIGNDVDGETYGYKLHLIYGCKASPSERAYQTINDSPEAITFSWEVKTVPVNVSGYKPTSCLTIDSTKVTEADLLALEAVLFGADEFKNDKDYAEGAFVTHGEGTAAKTYKALAAVEAGEWSESDWEAVYNGVGPMLLKPDDVIAFFA